MVNIAWNRKHLQVACYNISFQRVRTPHKQQDKIEQRASAVAYKLLSYATPIQIPIPIPKPISIEIRFRQYLTNLIEESRAAEPLPIGIIYSPIRVEEIQVEDLCSFLPGLPEVPSSEETSH